MKRTIIITSFTLLIGALVGIVIFTLIPKPLLDTIFRGIGGFCLGYGVIWITKKLLNEL